MTPAFAIAVLLTLGLLSQVLTLASLWQRKEWRWDRLREHLRREGAARELFGVTRPTLVAAASVLNMAGFLDARAALTLLTAALALIVAVQVGMRRQRKPTWTSKARAIVATAAGIDAAAAVILSEFLPQAALGLPLLQPMVLLLSWILWKPVDAILKHRILGKAAAVRAQFPSLTVIGITGSVGKTTAKELLAAVLGSRAMASPAYVNSEIGVARWMMNALNNLPQGVDTLVVEMGAYREGEILQLCDIAQPTIGIVTSVGQQHIALFGSQEALQRAKGELPAAIPENGHVFLNADSELCRDLKSMTQAPVTLVGTATPVDLLATDPEEVPGGIQFRTGSQLWHANLPGTQNVTNALLAIAVGQYLGIPDTTIAARLRQFQPLEHTFHVSTKNGVTVLDDTHNVSPQSFEAAIRWARAQFASPKVLLTSGLLELGELQEAVHARLGIAATTVFDRAVFTHATSMREFQQGFGKPCESWSKNTQPVTQGGVLVCVGRLPQSVVTSMLPPV